jgi:trimethylamine corrinoid protein
VLILSALTDALKTVGDRFECGELFLPDLVGGADTALAAMPVAEAELARTGVDLAKQATVVIGTVKGDIHDIGKKMVSTLLTAHGFRVIDLGADVPTATFARAVGENEADIVALSALLTTTAVQQGKVIQGLDDAGLRERVKTMVGGGAIDEGFAERIGADGYGATAPEAVELAKRLLPLG